MKNAIGVFDSGVGGLTVVKHLVEFFPHEDIIYFGDTARVPYGTKSAETIIKFSLQDAEFLVSQNVKCIVVACNTASAYAIEPIKKKFPKIPIIGMIEAGSMLAVKESQAKSIGVIGTSATIKSHVYKNKILELVASAKVYEQACPLFVPLVEEGFLDGSVCDEVVKHYINYYNDIEIDTLILGCTHYPLLESKIKNEIHHKVKLIDSGFASAVFLKEELKRLNLLNEKKESGFLHCFLSSPTDKFNEIAKQTLSRDITKFEIIDIEKI